MIHEDFGLLIVVFGMVIALLVVIVKLVSRDDVQSSQPVRLDPMNWHPGRFFPPTLNRLNRGDERPTRVGQEVGNAGRRVDGTQAYGSIAGERCGTFRADSRKVFRQIA